MKPASNISAPDGFQTPKLVAGGRLRWIQGTLTLSTSLASYPSMPGNMMTRWNGFRVLSGSSQKQII